LNESLKESITDTNFESVIVREIDNIEREVIELIGTHVNYSKVEVKKRLKRIEILNSVRSDIATAKLITQEALFTVEA